MTARFARAGEETRPAVAPQERSWRAYQAGYVAQVHGVLETDNPFPATDPSNGYWATGWANANAGIDVPWIPEQGVAPPPPEPEISE